MLSTDEIIIQILSQAKKDNNDLIKHFKISYPSNQVAQESNTIFVASVDAETQEIGYDFQTYLDRVEILIVTKNKEYQKAIMIIKTVSREIIRLIRENSNLFENTPIVERVTPEYNKDFVLTRGHLMVQVKTKPDDANFDDDFRRVCQILTEDMDVIEK